MTLGSAQEEILSSRQNRPKQDRAIATGESIACLTAPPALQRAAIAATAIVTI
jgi:hypothetical protein